MARPQYLLKLNYCLLFSHMFSFGIIHLLEQQKYSFLIRLSCAAIFEKSRYKSRIYTLISFPLIW